MEKETTKQKIKRWIFGNDIDLAKIKLLEENGIKPVF
jgi:hypothetical protein